MCACSGNIPKPLAWSSVHWRFVVFSPSIACRQQGGESAAAHASRSELMERNIDDDRRELPKSTPLLPDGCHLVELLRRMRGTWRSPGKRAGGVGAGSRSTCTRVERGPAVAPRAGNRIRARSCGAQVHPSSPRLAKAGDRAGRIAGARRQRWN
jgi:hypothetical protein